MKKLLLLFMLFSLASSSYARAGIAEIIFTTPGGHNICHCDPYPDSLTPVLIEHEQLNQLEEWYFYKNHIIGKGYHYYFIFNETTEKIQKFNDKKDWEAEIEKQDLKPFYTQWLDLSDSPDSLFLFIIAIFIIPIVLVILLFIGILTYAKVIKWTRKSFIITGVILCTLVLIAYLYLTVGSF